MTPNTLLPTPPQAVPTVPVAGEVAPVAAVAPPPERELARIGVSMFRRYPLRCLGYLVGSIGLVAYAAYLNAYEYSNFLTVTLLVAGLLLAARGVFWWVKMTTTSLLLTSRRLLLESGVVSRQATDFPLRDVNDIQIDQGIAQRIFGVGDMVIIHMAGEERRQIVVMAVPNPHGVAALIREAKEADAQAHAHG